MDAGLALALFAFAWIGLALELALALVVRSWLMDLTAALQEIDEIGDVLAAETKARVDSTERLRVLEQKYAALLALHNRLVQAIKKGLWMDKKPQPKEKQNG